MKNQLLSFAHCQTAARAWWLGLSLLAAASVTAQNFVKNPDFEEPLGTNNWTIVYAPVFGGGANQPTNCGPFDFLFAGRSTIAHKDMNPGTWDGEDRTGTNYWSKFGGHFAPNHSWMMHAYFKQVVKGLTPGAYYTVSAWMGFFGGNDAFLDKCNIYLEAIGALGSLTTPYPASNVLNVQNHPENWQRYSVTQRANGAGEIEVRLHFNKYGTQAYWEWRNFNAFYDHVSVVPQSQPTFPPDNLTVGVTNQVSTNRYATLTNGTLVVSWRTVTNEVLVFRWNTVMYNTYDIEVTTDAVSWSKFAAGIRATGPTTTYLAPWTGPTNASPLFRIVPYNYVAPSPSEFLPPCRIVSLTRSNQDIALTWESVVNNSYRLQYTRDVSDPASWAFVKWSPKLDTNLYANDLSYTFKTNLACLFSFDPAFDPSAPVFFRFTSAGYRP